MSRVFGSTESIAYPGGPTGPPGSFQRWLRLATALLLVVVLVLLAPLAERLPGIGPQVKVLRDSGVETGAWWWASVPEVAEAVRHMRGVNPGD
jgi:hypothetical protein